MTEQLTSRHPSMRSRRRRALLTVSAAAILGAVGASGAAIAADEDADAADRGLYVLAQAEAGAPSTVPQPAAEEGDEEESKDEIVVTGIRSSFASALQTKRNADSIVDSISAEGIGRFPDLNLAESIQRITGVQIIRDEFRSGRVSIRGLPSKFAITQVNGQSLASPNFSDGFVFGIFEANVIAGVDVVKTPTVAMEEGGLSGIVNLKPRTALSFEKDTHFFIQGEAVYEGLARSIAPEVTFSAGKKFADDTFGVFITAGYHKQDFRTDAARISSYRSVDTDMDTVPDLFVPNDFRFNARKVDGARISAAGGFEWAPTDSFDLTFTGLFSRNDVKQPLHELRVSNIGAYTVLDTIDDPKFGSTATKVNYVGPRVQNQSRINDEIQQTWATTLDAKWSKGPWDLSGAVHYTEGLRDRFFVQIIRRIDSHATNGVTIDLDTGGTNPYDFTFLMTPDPGDPFTFSFTNPNPRLSTQIIPDASLARYERQFATQFDVERDFDWLIFESLEFGGKYRHLEQENEDRRASATGADLTVLSDALFVDSLFSQDGGFFQNSVSYQPFQVLNSQAVLDLILPINTTEPLTPEGFIANPNFNGVFNNKQDLLSGYFIGNFGFDIGGVHVRGNSGVRVVRTQRTSEAQVRVAGVLEDASIDTNFTNVLPQTNLIFDLKENLIFRASYAKTIVRPDPNEFRAARSVSLVQDAVTSELIAITSSTNNAELLPFSARSIDFSLEWYNREGSAFHIAYFRKRVAGDTVRVAECPATIPGVEDLITGTPMVIGNQCLDEAGVELIVMRQFNSPETFNIQGAEFGMTQNLDFLPAPWDNFGFQANYTYIDASESGDFDANGNPLPLPEISKHSANIILYYETDKFGVRLAHNYRSKFFVTSAGTFLGDDRLISPRNQLDLSMSYNVNERLRLGFEAFNLTAEDRFEYQGTPSRFRDLNNEGRTFTLSASWEM